MLRGGTPPNLSAITSPKQPIQGLCVSVSASEFKFPTNEVWWFKGFKLEADSCSLQPLAESMKDVHMWALVSSRPCSFSESTATTTKTSQPNPKNRSRNQPPNLENLIAIMSG